MSMNLLKNKIQCIECSCKNLIKDYERQEIYCAKCGLVLVDNEIPQIISQIKSQELTQNDNEKQENIKLEKLAYYKLKKYFYNFY